MLLYVCVHALVCVHTQQHRRVLNESWENEEEMLKKCGSWQKYLKMWKWAIMAGTIQVE